MEATLGTKPAAIAADYGRSGPHSAQAAVAADLGASRSVSAADPAAAAHNDPPRTIPGAQDMTHDLLIDPQAREVMFRALSRAGRTGIEAAMSLTSGNVFMIARPADRPRRTGSS
jgi:hypothetical protein